MTAEPLAHPEWLWPIALSCAAAALALALAGLRARRLRRRLAPALGAATPPLRDLALLAALAAIGVALLGPRLGERVVRGPATGVDVVLLLDTSRSMDASDVAPSRIARAQRAAGDLLARLDPSDRAALAVFASRGVLLTPLTPDHGVLLELLDAVDTGLVRPAGSHLGGGVRAALSAFEAGSERPRVVVVLSDGEDPERSSDLGVAAALDAGARVLAVAFGTEAGAVVPDHGVPLRDATGNVVISRRRSDRLLRLASATGGRLLADDARGSSDGAAAAAELRRDAGGRPGEWVERRVSAVRVLPFVAFAFALLVAEAIARPARGARRPRRGRGRRALAAAALLAAAGAGPGGSAPAVTDIEARLARTPRDPALLVELGIERLARGRHGAARRAFLAAALTSSDPSLAALAYYDLGVAALLAGDLEDARDAFFDALALAPRDREARFNLEWTLAQLALDPPESPARGTEEEEQAAEAAAEERPEPVRHERPEPDASPVALGEDERRRWLGRVRDDLGHTLRSATRAGNERPRRGPVW